MLRSLFVTLALAGVAASTIIQGKLKFGTSLHFEVDYSLDVDAGNITFMLTSDGHYDWYAFGLHNKSYGGMPDAEVFICNPQPSNLAGVFCQVGHTTGHTTPTIAKKQYIQLMSAGRSKDWANATFTRSISKSKSADLSYDIRNETIMVISACGYWSPGKPMPYGSPMRHTTNGFAIVNFFEANLEQGQAT